MSQLVLVFHFYSFSEFFWEGLDLWNFQMYFWVILSISIWVPCVFYLILLINLGKIDFIIIMSLSTQEKGIALHLFQFCSCQCTYLTHLFRFIHMYMMCEAIENFIFTSICSCSSLIYRNIVSFCMLIFYTAILLNSAISSRVVFDHGVEIYIIVFDLL